MKRFLLFAAMATVLGSAAMAETNYLHIATATGWELIDLDKAERLTFKGGNMTVTDNNGKTISSYPQSTLEMMYVNQVTGVMQINGGLIDPLFKVENYGRDVTLLADGTFEVFTLEGQCLVSIPDVTAGKSVNLSALSAGVYIYRLGEYSVKCILN